MTREQELKQLARRAGLTVETYSPGDGVTRYRFFQNAPPDQSYFGPKSGFYTALGLKEAKTFLEGAMAGI